MHLSVDEAREFFRLHNALMFFVNRRLRVLKARVADAEAYGALGPSDRAEVHEAFLEHPDLLGEFVAENPAGFGPDDLAAVRAWEHRVSGTFAILRQLRHHMIFLGHAEPHLAYGVVGLAHSLNEMLGPRLPMLVDTTLLPFRGKIVYDGMLFLHDVHLGPGVRRGMNASYKESRAAHGLITALPAPAASAGSAPATGPAEGSPRASGAADEASIPKAVRPAYEAVMARVASFCRAHLDGDYEALCRELAGVLARKRPSPLTRGKPESWAAGIVRAIGHANFLDDPSQTLHMKMSEIDERMGVSTATGSAKAREVRDLVDIGRFEPRWTLPAMQEKNPYLWLVSIDGLPYDARNAPRDIQEELFRRGLIPFIPGERAGLDDGE